MLTPTNILEKIGNIKKFFNINKIEEEFKEKAEKCLENKENENIDFETLFSSNIININFFWKKIEDKNKKILEEFKILKENPNYIAAFSIKYRDYKELTKSYITRLKDEIEIMKTKWVFLEEINFLEKKVLNYEKEFHKILEEINKK